MSKSPSSGYTTAQPKLITPTTLGESLETLQLLKIAEIVDIPEDKRKYLFLGFLLQIGMTSERFSSSSGTEQHKLRRLARVSEFDFGFEPNPKNQWQESKGTPSLIKIAPGEIYKQELCPGLHSDIMIKYFAESDSLPEVRVYLKGKEIKISTSRYLTILKIALLPSQKVMNPTLELSIRNTGLKELVFGGVGDKLKIRYLELVIHESSLTRKIKRAMSLIKNREIKALVKSLGFFAKGKLLLLKRNVTKYFVAASVVSTCTLFSSCVLPPNDIGPRVYSATEIEYVSDIQKGIDYSQAGRFDKAEYYLRQALAKTTSPPALLLTDLGFTLRAQGKFADALVYLNKALDKDPHFLHARVTLGRTYFEMGDIDSAMREYKKTQDDFNDFWGGTPDKRLTNDFGNDDLLFVHTNLAIMYAQKGDVAESICHSKAALDLGGASYKRQSHARFLISLEEYSLASDVLKDAIFTGQQVSSPLPPKLAANLDPSAPPPTTAPEEDPSLILDMGVVTFLQDNMPLAAEAFDRVLTLTIVPTDIRELAQLLRYEVANAQNDSETIELLNKSFEEISDDLCESDTYATPPFWPIKLKNRVVERRNKICSTQTGWFG